MYGVCGTYLSLLRVGRDVVGRLGARGDPGFKAVEIRGLHDEPFSAH